MQVKAALSQTIIVGNLKAAFAIKSAVKAIIVEEQSAMQEDKPDTCTDDLPDTDDNYLALILESFNRAGMHPALAEKNFNHIATKFSCSAEIINKMKSFFLSPGTLDPASNAGTERMDETVGPCKRPASPEDSDLESVGDDDEGNHPDDFEIVVPTQPNPFAALVAEEVEEETPVIGATTPSSEEFVSEAVPCLATRKRGKLNKALAEVEKETPVEGLAKKQSKKKKRR